jgi:hypothetical protein
MYIDSCLDRGICSVSRRIVRRLGSGYSSGRAQRTAGSACTVAEDVGVDHGRGHFAVAEELLDGADIVTALQKVGGEGVAEGVAVLHACRRRSTGRHGSRRAARSSHGRDAGPRSSRFSTAWERETFSVKNVHPSASGSHKALCDTHGRGGRIKVYRTRSRARSAPPGAMFQAKRRALERPPSRSHLEPHPTGPRGSVGLHLTAGAAGSRSQSANYTSDFLNCR